MTPLYTHQDFLKSKYTTKLPLKCENCSSTFYRSKRSIKSVDYELSKISLNYCCSRCKADTIESTSVQRACKVCGSQFNQARWKIGTPKEQITCSVVCSNNLPPSKYKLEQARKQGMRVIGNLSDPEVQARRKATFKRNAEERYAVTPFDLLGVGSKRRRVFEEQNQCCGRCKRDTWEGEKIPLELDHINGNRNDNCRENLIGLCPNCHALTDTWRGRNTPSNKHGRTILSDEVLLGFLNQAPNIRQGLLDAGMSPRGNNYVRARRLLFDPD